MYEYQIAFGAGDAKIIAPIYDQILIHFSKFMQAYQDQEFEGIMKINF